MKILEIKNKPKAELKDLLLKKREELRKLKFESAARKLKNVKAISAVKKDIARILTALNSEKE